MENTETKPIVVAVAGHFNPLHVGHLQMIREAKTYGDKLVVIVANDYQAEKKRSKVFMSENDRLEIISSLRDVDEVCLSHDLNSNVCLTLEILHPDVFCSGCDANHPDAIEERKICDKLGIKTVYNVGGEKIQSSSTLLNNYVSSQ